jgi:hypothetical protein
MEWEKFLTKVRKYNIGLKRNAELSGGSTIGSHPAWFDKFVDLKYTHCNLHTAKNYGVDHQWSAHHWLTNTDHHHCLLLLLPMETAELPHTFFCLIN